MRTETAFGSLLAVAVLLANCGASAPLEPLTIAAAANLDQVLPRLVARFESESQAETVVSFGSTSSLSQQIENGAPFDVFLAADVAHVDKLIAQDAIATDSKAVYALGKLAVWGPQRFVNSLEELADPEIRFIGVANPAFAPYGAAAVEALRAAGLWEAVEDRVVYAQNVRIAKQYAESGNADVAFVALSLLDPDDGERLLVDAASHRPIEQALGIVRDARRPEEARRFVRFLLSPDAQRILGEHGYDAPRPERPLVD